MKIISVATAVVLGIALTGCTPKPKPAPASENIESAAMAPAAPVASFTIGAIDQDETDIMGCTTMLGKTDDSLGLLFLEDAVDTGAKGFMKIDGQVIKVGLTSNTFDEGKNTGKRLFASADGNLSIVEDLTIGEQHPDSDSVDMSGRLTVTYKGMIQTVPVKGGTAC